MVIVEVEQGLLRGSAVYLPSGGRYFSFKGIPYAQPPIGTLRFKDPQPPQSWEGVRDALKHGPRCPQYNKNPLSTLIGTPPPAMEEDCLYLNVYTRSCNVHNKTPVMFWIHGGNFKMGSGDDDLYGPKYFMEQYVVLVTINYRLEALGFLCMDTADVPGNAGLKDQVIALRWVKQNIEKFGGDPDKITIFGCGDSSVALMLVSPLAKGLFTKAIVQSGSAIGDSSHIENGRDIAFELGKACGKETTDTSELLEFLQSLPVEDLVNSTTKVMGTCAYWDRIFLPVIENINLGVPGFLWKDPIDYLKCGEATDVPIIIGATSGEGAIHIQEDLERLELLNERPDVFVTRELRAGRSPEETTRIGSVIREHYLQGRNIGEDTVPQLLNLRSDQSFVHSIYRMARFLSNSNCSPVYFYYFNYVGGLNIMDVILDAKYAGILPLAVHGFDVFFMFNNIIVPKLFSEPPDAKFIKHFTTLWSHFAKTGNPTPDNKLGVKWERFSPELKNYLVISNPLAVQKNFHACRMKMWDDLYQKYGLPL